MAEATKEIRIAWRINRLCGGGLWRIDAPGGLWEMPAGEWRKVLERHVEAGNARYGAGTHWIEEREVGRHPGAAG